MIHVYYDTMSDKVFWIIITLQWYVFQLMTYSLFKNVYDV